MAAIVSSPDFREQASNPILSYDARMSAVPCGHDPVLMEAVLRELAPRAGQRIVDCTMGLGGHAQLIAQKLGPGGLLIGIDADPRNLELARMRLGNAPCPIRFFHANFAELPQVLAAAQIPRVDGLLADLGVSTNQLFDSQYGLSFSIDMDLDMRLDPRVPRSAADLVNSLPERDLANVLYELAQERYSRRIARKIVEARRVSPITTTLRLCELVRQAVGKRPRRITGTQRTHSQRRAPEIDDATRTFLALRMEVNQELPHLQALLEAAPRCLNAGGRRVVISLQSSEDRVVKRALLSAKQRGLLDILTAKPLCPDQQELAGNPRSRSAKLRAAQRTAIEAL